MTKCQHLLISDDILSKNLLRSSIGKDTRLSTLRAGFDSPSKHQVIFRSSEKASRMTVNHQLLVRSQSSEPKIIRVVGDGLQSGSKPVGKGSIPLRPAILKKGTIT